MIARMRVFFYLVAVVLLAGPVVQSSAAGVNSTAHFVLPGDFAIGVEPELTLTNGAGVAANLRYTHGLTELTNATLIVGIGGGARQFRVGGNMTFDFFPDVHGQPGIGIALQGLYYRLAANGTNTTTGQFEVTGAPYIHKTFFAAGGEIEPFLAFPLGMAFTSGRYKAISSVAIGALFKSAEHLRYVTEFGMAVNNTESYFAGGIVYYH
jgi:hypothetical protein